MAWYFFKKAFHMAMLRPMKSEPASCFCARPKSRAEKVVFALEVIFFAIAFICAALAFAGVIDTDCWYLALLLLVDVLVRVAAKWIIRIFSPKRRVFFETGGDGRPVAAVLELENVGGRDAEILGAGFVEWRREGAASSHDSAHAFSPDSCAGQNRFPMPFPRGGVVSIRYGFAEVADAHSICALYCDVDSSAFPGWLVWEERLPMNEEVLPKPPPGVRRMIIPLRRLERYSMRLGFPLPVKLMLAAAAVLAAIVLALVFLGPL